MHCVDAVNGKVLWQGAGQADLFPTPAILGDIMVVRGHSCVEAFKISPQKAEKLWSAKNCGDLGASPVIYKDHVYACGQAYNRLMVMIVDLKTGSVTLNQQRSGSTTCTTPVVADGKVFTFCDTSWEFCHPIAFNTTPDKFEQVGEMPQVKAAPYSSPAIAAGKLFVRLADGVACYDLKQ